MNDERHALLMLGLAKSRQIEAAQRERQRPAIEADRRAGRSSAIVRGMRARRERERRG